MSNFLIASLLPVLFGASNWNETKHILMGANIRFKSNGMSYINVCKKRVQKPLRNKSNSDGGFLWLYM